MSRKIINTLATGSYRSHVFSSIDGTSQNLRFATLFSAKLYFRIVALLLLHSISNLSLAQTLVIDINVVGLNENQSRATTQVNQACESLAGDTSAQAIELQEVCDLVNSLDVNNVEESNLLQEIADALAPEEAFALNDSLSVISDYQTTNVLARLNSLRNPLLRNSAFNGDAAQQEQQLSLNSNRLNFGQVGGGASADLVAPIGVFINGHVSSGEFDGGQLQQDADIAANSFTIGGDYRFNEKVVAGIGAGFVQDAVNFTSVAGGAESDGFNLSAFATWYETDQGYLDVVLDFGRSDYTLERSITIFANNPLTATSTPTALSTSFTVSGGRNFKPFGFDLGGYFRLSYTGATIDAYSESLKVQQPGFAALYRVDDQTVVSTEMVLGLSLSKAISLNNAVLLPLLRIEYVTENDRKKDAIKATLISTGTTAEYLGEDRDVGFSTLGLGASAIFRGGRSAYAYYETHLQHDVISQHWLKTGIRLEF